MFHSVKLWNMESPDALPIVLSGHEGEVWSLAYSADDKHLVTGSHDRTIRVGLGPSAERFANNEHSRHGLPKGLAQHDPR